PGSWPPCTATGSGARRAMPSSGTASTHWPRGSGFMLRRGERAVVLGAIAAIVLAAVAGVVTAPTRDLDDPRLSSYLAGPHGAKGLAQTLRHLGMTVEQRRHPYFDLARCLRVWASPF